MNVHENDKKILTKIISCCCRIQNTVNRFGDLPEIFCVDNDFQDSVCMNILQIGEYAGKLSEDFKNNYSAVNWKAIRGMRNIFAHNYGSVDLERTWDTVKYDIPDLKLYCEKIISEC